jgi:3-dehydroquinate dehydratase
LPAKQRATHGLASRTAPRFHGVIRKAWPQKDGIGDHQSNIHSREEFRKKSVTAPACIGQISGFGFFGYVMALEAMAEYISKEKTL